MIQYNIIILSRDKEAAFTVLPTVRAVIKEFYNCSNMIGLELEDFGGMDTASSHWEQRILSMEFMIGYISSAAPMSVFSMAVFEDSGWYKMDWIMLQFHHMVSDMYNIFCFCFCFCFRFYILYISEIIQMDVCILLYINLGKGFDVIGMNRNVLLIWERK